MNYASPLRRFVAYSVDWLILLIVDLLLLVPVISSPSPVDLFSRGIQLFMWIFLFHLFIYSIIHAFFTSRFGGTPGKLLTGIEVVTENGSKISFKRALFRYEIGYSISMVFFGLGFIWIVLDKKTHQGWEDMVSQTYVIVRNEASLLIGIIVSILFIIGSLFMIGNLISTFKQNLPVYQEIIESTQSNEVTDGPIYQYINNPINK